STLVINGIAMIRYNPGGDFLWERHWTGQYTSHPELRLACDEQGAIYGLLNTVDSLVQGYQVPFKNGLLLLKLDTSGSLLDATKILMSGSNPYFDLSVFPDG